MQSPSGTPDDGKATSSKRQKLRPAGPSELVPTIVEWSNRPEVRDELMTLMALFGCSAAEAVNLWYQHRILCNLDEMMGAEPDNDSWGPGANPDKEK